MSTPENISPREYGPPPPERPPVTPAEREKLKERIPGLEEYEKSMEIFNAEKLLESEGKEGGPEKTGKEPLERPAEKSDPAGQVEQKKDTAMDKLGRALNTIGEFFGRLGEKISAAFSKMKSGSLKGLMRFAEMAGLGWAAEFLRPMVEPAEIREAMQASMPEGVIVKETPEDAGHTKALRGQYERRLKTENKTEADLSFETFYKEKISKLSEQHSTKPREDNTYTLAELVQTDKEREQNVNKMTEEAKHIEAAGGKKVEGQSNQWVIENLNLGNEITKMFFIFNPDGTWQWSQNDQLSWDGAPLSVEGFEGAEKTAREGMNTLREKLKIQQKAVPQAAGTNSNAPAETKEDPEEIRKLSYMNALANSLNRLIAEKSGDPAIVIDKNDWSNTARAVIAALQSGGAGAAIGLEMDGGTLEANDTGSFWGGLWMNEYNLLYGWDTDLLKDPVKAVVRLMKYDPVKNGLDSLSKGTVLALQKDMRNALGQDLKNAMLKETMTQIKNWRPHRSAI